MQLRPQLKPMHAFVAHVVAWQPPDDVDEPDPVPLLLEPPPLVLPVLVPPPVPDPVQISAQEHTWRPSHSSHSPSVPEHAPPVLGSQSWAVPEAEPALQMELGPHTPTMVLT
jgi:hypothetical protein